MSAESVLTREKIEEIAEAVYEKDQFPNTDEVWCNLYWLSSFAKAIEQAVLQSDEVRALRKNAERYQYLRHPDTGPAKLDSLHNWVNDDCNPPYRELMYGDDLDAAIDAAMQEQKT